VRLVAPLAIRVRRVMQHRWVREEPARKLISESDNRRSRFHENYFGIDWADPKEYHLTVNSGLLGPSAIDLIAYAAGQHWLQSGEESGRAS
jgi:cytidylate kinase